MRSPFEEGQRQGRWTEEDFKESGFASIQKALANEERLYQEELADLPELRQKNPEYAQMHAEFLEGLISATRESLGVLLAAEVQRR